MIRLYSIFGQANTSCTSEFLFYNTVWTFEGPEKGGWTNVGAQCKLGGSDSLISIDFGNLIPSCSLYLMINLRSYINTRKSVSSGIQTPRSRLKRVESTCYSSEEGRTPYWELYNVIYQTLERVFHQVSKHLEVRKKKTRLRLVFSTCMTQLHFL